MAHTDDNGTTCHTAEEISVMANAVKRGVKVLDRVWGLRWRAVMRRHSDDFNIANTDSCILGTLVNHTAVGKKMRKDAEKEAFCAAVNHLKLSANDHGFDAGDSSTYPALEALWRAEFEEGRS